MRAPRVTLISEDQYRTSYWPAISATVSQILSFTHLSISQSDLYSQVYNVCAQRHSKRLHEDILGLITRYIDTSLVSLCTLPEHSFLGQFTTMSTGYKKAIAVIAPLFQYLEKVYSFSRERSTLHILLTKLWHDRVVLVPGVTDRLFHTIKTIPCKPLYSSTTTTTATFQYAPPSSSSSSLSTSSSLSSSLYSTDFHTTTSLPSQYHPYMSTNILTSSPTASFLPFSPFTSPPPEPITSFPSNIDPTLLRDLILMLHEKDKQHVLLNPPLFSMFIPCLIPCQGYEEDTREAMFLLSALMSQGHMWGVPLRRDPPLKRKWTLVLTT
eukprot:TRINITY_DN5891_c1_g1_i1.p1 TRINITY_DN5891_c1_g1~~TRINITY_DN5891_c1_g1_i1.p1  ORF type:complete len:346 (+),score=71.37 TRINITY_DN5891_c1_g1_i1:66-1040(+)